MGYRITGRIAAQSTAVTTESVGSSFMSMMQVLVDQCKQSAVAFLEAAVAYFAKLGVRIERVMTDNASCCRSKMFRAASKRFGLRQIFTRPYTAKTTGKAKGFAAKTGARGPARRSGTTAPEPSVEYNRERVALTYKMGCHSK